MKILYIQYAGDFHEAYNRLIVENGKENYYGQTYSVEYVVKQVRDGNNVLVLVLHGSESDITLLEPNLKASNYGGRNVYKRLFSDISKFMPDRVILRIPDPKILRFLRRGKFKTFPVFADSFESFGAFRGQILKFLLSYELKNKHISYIGNHQINPSKSLMKLGVPAKNIVPYDWPHNDSPSNWQKSIPEDISSKKLMLFFAGQLKVEKGLEELIRAVKLLRNTDKQVQLDIAGNGNIDYFKVLGRKLNIESNINFLGSIDHQNVLEYMNAADIVVVPSRHEYPEGLPMTIMESLMVHTPVIVSDHPMFVGRVGTKGGVVFFRQKEPEDLVYQLQKLVSDFNLYERTCIATTAEWHALELKFKWGNMIDEWLFNDGKSRLEMHSLNSYELIDSLYS